MVLKAPASQVNKLNDIVSEIQAFCNNVLCTRSQSLSDHDRHVVSLAADCRDLADELRALLETMQARNGGWGRALLQTLRKKGNVDDLWQQLSRLDVRLRESVGQSLQM